MNSCVNLPPAVYTLPPPILPPKPAGGWVFPNPIPTHGAVWCWVERVGCFIGADPYGCSFFAGGAPAMEWRVTWDGMTGGGVVRFVESYPTATLAQGRVMTLAAPRAIAAELWALTEGNIITGWMLNWTDKAGVGQYERFQSEDEARQRAQVLYGPEGSNVATEPPHPECGPPAPPPPPPTPTPTPPPPPVHGYCRGEAGCYEVPSPIFGLYCGEGETFSQVPCTSTPDAPCPKPEFPRRHIIKKG